MRRKTHEVRRVLRLRQVRRSKEMTQAQLAAKCGVSKTFICEIEKGKVNPSLTVARDLAKALNLTIDEAFQYVEVPA